MAYGLSRIQFPDSGMDFTKLPFFLLYICGDGLGGQKGLWNASNVWLARPNAVLSPHRAVWKGFLSLGCTRLCTNYRNQRRIGSPNSPSVLTGLARLKPSPQGLLSLARPTARQKAVRADIPIQIGPMVPHLRQ